MTRDQAPRDAGVGQGLGQIVHKKTSKVGGTSHDAGKSPGLQGSQDGRGITDTNDLDVPARLEFSLMESLDRPQKAFV